MLGTVDKVFEQFLSRQVYNQFDNVFDPGISAYRSMYNCETTLIGLTEKWKLAMDSKKYVSILSTYLSKAFDSLHP